MVVGTGEKRLNNEKTLLSTKNKIEPAHEISNKVAFWHV